MNRPNESFPAVSGSVTPQLEGAPRTAAHESRAPLHPIREQEQKGGDRHS